MPLLLLPPLPLCFAAADAAPRAAAADLLRRLLPLPDDV